MSRIGYFLIALPFLGFQSLIVQAGTSVEPDTSIGAVHRRGHIIDMTYNDDRARRVLLSESEPGYREVEHLFLGALARSQHADQCCPNGQPKVSISFRHPYFVQWGDQPVLIERLTLAEDSSSDRHYLLLNDALVFYPRTDNQNFTLLMDWSEGAHN